MAGPSLPRPGGVHRLDAFTEPPPGEPIRVDVDGISVAVYNHDGHLYALESRCTHQGGPLDEGEVSGASVTCPWHGSVFALATGQVEQGPATRPVRAFGARMEGTTLVLEER